MFSFYIEVWFLSFISFIIGMRVLPPRVVKYLLDLLSEAFNIRHR